MPLTISCPVCGLGGQVPDGSPAGEAQCPRCHASFMVPASDRISTPTPDTGSHVHRLDDYFANLGEPNARPASGPQPSLPTVVPLPSQPGDAATEVAWLKEERQRFDDYTAKQFGQLQRQREELAGWRTQVEEALVAREQENNRQAKILQGRAETLVRRETELTTRIATLDQREQDLATQEQDRAAMRQEVAELRELLQQLKAEAVADEKTAKEMRTECLRLDTARRRRQKTWETELAEWNEIRRRMEEREAQGDRADAALQRRAREIEELEAKIRAELERREDELSRGWRELEERAGTFG